MPAVGLLLLALAPLASVADEPHIPLGQKVISFELPDYLGTQHKLADLAEKKAVVVVFLGTECPLAKLYAARLAELAAKFEPQEVAFLGINANQHDSLAKIAHYAKEHKIEFPILKDAGNVVADRLGATRTPEAFVLDRERIVRYWGQIDDQYGVGYARPSPTKHYLAAALDELLAGKPVSQPAVEPVGCHISRVRRSEPTGEITYTKHVARALHQNCVRCHRPGEVAPFSLATYDEAAAWAETIREVISDKRMPPWHANPEHGKFWNDARLSDDDKRLIFTWIDNGCPQGEAADLPMLPTFSDGWQIETPDVVYKIPQPFAVPAKGTVEYQYFTIDPGFKEDVWIKAAEARPGNRSVTHHLILFFHPPGSDEIQPIEPLFNSIAGFAPGMPPAVYPAGVYRRVPAGSKLIIQAHYTPNGTAQEDQSEFGLVFAEAKEVKQEYQVQAVLNFRFMIPPGAKDFRLEATHKVDQESLLHALTPHMHLRGKSFVYEAVYPDGREEVLLDVPRYDFNWQNTYALAEPKLLPAGTVIRCTATYDNSAGNLANPNPRAAVTWGDQTWQEMMVGTLGLTWAEQDLSAGLPQSKRLESGEYEVTFAYRPPTKAEAVYLAGSFNDWKPDDLLMDGPDEDGRYTRRVPLKPGEYEYKFVIDGTDWKTDPGNPRQMGFYRNSVLRVGD